MRALGKGRDAAKHLDVLAADTGLSPRAIQEAMQELRHLEHPICSTPEHGVWFGERAADIDATLAQLDSRIRSQFATRSALRRVRRRLAGIQRGEVELMFWPEVAA